jgi:RNA polymerase sigma-70 factor, ECF subfamily
VLALASIWHSGDASRSSPISNSLEARASRGDRPALEALLREHARALLDLCRILVGPTEARDATQESLEKIVIHIARFDPAKGSFRTWAFAIARNTCRDRRRRAGLERKTFAPDGDEWTAAAHSDAPDAERVALARASSARLAAALETLPEAMRLCVVLFHVHEATYEEIASTLEVPMGTVMTWLHRGRKRLRAALEESEHALA